MITFERELALSESAIECRAVLREIMDTDVLLYYVHIVARREHWDDGRLWRAVALVAIADRARVREELRGMIGAATGTE